MGLKIRLNNLIDVNTGKRIEVRVSDEQVGSSLLQMAEASNAGKRAAKKSIEMHKRAKGRKGK